MLNVLTMSELKMGECLTKECFTTDGHSES